MPGVCPVAKYAPSAIACSANAPSVMAMSTWSPSPVRCARTSAASSPATPSSEPPARSAICTPGIAGRAPTPVWLSTPGAPDVVDVVAGLLGARAVGAVAADGDVDELRVDGCERFVAEAEAIHHAGPEALDERVGGLGERQQRFAASSRRFSSTERLLRSVTHVKRRRVADLRLVGAHRVAGAGLLDLDHVRAEVGEQRGGEGARAAGGSGRGRGCPRAGRLEWSRWTIYRSVGRLSSHDDACRPCGHCYRSRPRHRPRDRRGAGRRRRRGRGQLPPRRGGGRGDRGGDQGRRRPRAGRAGVARPSWRAPTRWPTPRWPPSASSTSSSTTPASPAAGTPSSTPTRPSCSG